MISSHRHAERHRIDRIGWLCATVLGANDGIVSTARLMVGVAAANSSHGSILLTGIAGLVAGEYVSVHSQVDTDKAVSVARAARARKRSHLRTT
jgi:vacuolar iron transporter family protein